MELHTLENLHEDFETGVWKVRKFVLPNASEYLWDIDNILNSFKNAHLNIL